MFKNIFTQSYQNIWPFICIPFKKVLYARGCSNVDMLAYQVRNQRYKFKPWALTQAGAGSAVVSL